MIYDLTRFRDNFVKERAVIEKAKCLYAYQGDLTSFIADGIYVSVEKIADGYYLYYDHVKLKLTGNQRMITYYEIL